MAACVVVAGGAEGRPSAECEVLDVAEGRWTVAAPLLVPRFVHTLDAVTGGRRAVATGGFGASMSAIADVEIFDGASSSSWKALPAMPTARGGHATAVVGGGERIIVVGGTADRRSGLSAVEMLDLSAGSWQTLPEVSPRMMPGVVAGSDGRLYVFGGAADTSGGIAQAGALDLKEGRWQELPPMPTPRAGHVSAVVGDRVYALGGSTDGVAFVAAAEAFDVRAGRWAELPQMPQTRSGHAVAVSAGKLVVAGGSVDRRTPTETVDVFDTATERWETAAPMSTPRHALCLLAGAGDQQQVVAIGGRTKDQPLASAEILNLSENKWTQLPDMAARRIYFGAASLLGHN